MCATGDMIGSLFVGMSMGMLIGLVISMYAATTCSKHEDDA